VNYRKTKNSNSTRKKTELLFRDVIFDFSLFGTLENEFKKIDRKEWIV
jgi:hypothetical protein